MGVAAAGNLYYSGMNPSSGTAVFPPPSSTFGLTGVLQIILEEALVSWMMSEVHTKHFPPAAPPWLDQQLNNNNNDGHPTAWNQSLPMPYIQVCDSLPVIPSPNVNGSSLESPSMGLQRYHDTSATEMASALPMQGVRGHNINFYPPITATSFRVPTNPSRGAAIPTQTGFEMGPRHVGPAPPAGFRVYRPNRGVMHGTALGHRSLPPVGFVQVDDVALIDEVGNLVDHHRDMRLDIEDMSYEATDWQCKHWFIRGNNHNSIEDKTYLTPAAAINVEEAASDDQETDSCIICQDEFKDQEKIGVLRCEHEYHADCLKKWLLVKNVCPICKSEALTTGGRDA
ncbi:Zinc finger, RING-type [Sesbania bispinosa]|nr:Zinc finger, RING-type [Sesbania bispinosa]